ncbi:MAG: tol-pal system protein YbgF [Halocynthiibacter sp.]
MTRFIFLMCLVALPSGAFAQDQTLADIRQELTILNVEIQKLKRELSTTGGAQNAVGGSSVLERVNSIEMALADLTARTEGLDFRINRIVKDGTNRIGDLEFRLVELEGGDVSTLGETSTLGGGDAVLVQATPKPDTVEGPALAVSEKEDFEAAKAQLAAEDYTAAAAGFAAFVGNYPGSPLEAEAYFLGGEAQEKAGNDADAARAFLAGFSNNSNGPFAAKTLYRLGVSLGKLGQNEDACTMLSQVEMRFSGDPIVSDANAAMQNMGCS